MFSPVFVCHSVGAVWRSRVTVTHDALGLTEWAPTCTGPVPLYSALALSVEGLRPVGGTHPTGMILLECFLVLVSLGTYCPYQSKCELISDS